MSDRLEKEDMVLPTGELQPLPSLSNRACSFLSRSAWKNWRSQRKFWRRSDSLWRARVSSFPPGEPGCPSRKSSLQRCKFSPPKTQSDLGMPEGVPTDP